MIGLFVCVFFARFAALTPATIPRIGMVICSFWGLYNVWVTYKWVWPRGTDGGTSNASLDYYRAQLETRTDYGRHIWRRSGVVWCFVGLALVIEKALDRSPPAERTRYRCLLFSPYGLWRSSYSVRKRQAAKLKREIAELKRPCKVGVFACACGAGPAADALVGFLGLSG